MAQIYQWGICVYVCVCFFFPKKMKNLIHNPVEFVNSFSHNYDFHLVQKKEDGLLYKLKHQIWVSIWYHREPLNTKIHVEIRPLCVRGNFRKHKISLITSLISSLMVTNDFFSTKKMRKILEKMYLFECKFDYLINPS
jgi:hypothetical protein